ncbi:hypothetical protein [Aurantibacillus circumpalustris]|uniref:hypothetical protein n=1 Tax=Aurantibacillus circumpalustris TaxID=3036359 RepID=UPI00295ADBDC|nr:hypothetical protein [Aurantibacillus circumpalustris]
MCKLRHINKNLLLGILLLFSAGLFAQEEKLNRATQLFRSKAPGSVELAARAIDSVVLHPQTKVDFMAWTTRAFIYFDLYKSSDKFVLNSAYRDTIINSLLVSNKLQPDSSYFVQNNKLLLNLSKNYFNLSAALLQDSTNYQRSEIAFKRYKMVHRLVEPKMDFSSDDVKYYTAVGSQFSAVFIKDNNDSKSHEIAIAALLKVLEIQPDNTAANVNMGLMYYNQAVNMSKSLDYGADFSQIDIVQENMVKLAKQAEQFIHRVYANDNKNLKAVEALYYIYRMLNDNAKSDDFKKKGEELGIKFSEQAVDK